MSSIVVVSRSTVPAALCLGEALVVLQPHEAADVASSRLLRRSVGGAEANVAGGLAGLGVPATFVTRLGADPFGDAVAADLAERGVRVLGERDELRPTGLYLKEATPSGGTRMHYVRSGSAAGAMDAGLLDLPEVSRALAETRLVHTSGITAGILRPGSGLLDQLLELRDELGFTLSVDLNWRPALWRDRDPAALVELLRAADVVLAGVDEAGAALRASTPAALRELLGPRPTLVLKSDAHAAAEHRPDGGVTEVPALTVEVVEPVGAGDGFAAGYLAGLVDGLGPVARLRQGHLTAAAVLAVPGDHAAPPDAAERARLLSCSDDEWAAGRR